MPNTYLWKITQLECYPEHDGKTDVVVNIGWARIATDGSNTVTIGGSQSVILDAEAPFTPFEQITEAQVIGWLEDAIGAEMLAAQEAALDQQINNQINPPVISLPLPWA